MGKCRAKAIQTDFGTFRYNQAYPGIIQAYSEPCITLPYLELWYIQDSAYSEPEAYSEPWHIHNPGIFTTPGTFRTLIYSERWHIQNRRNIQNPVKYLR